MSGIWGMCSLTHYFILITDIVNTWIEIYPIFVRRCYQFGSIPYFEDVWEVHWIGEIYWTYIGSEYHNLLWNKPNRSPRLGASCYPLVWWPYQFKNRHPKSDFILIYFSLRGLKFSRRFPNIFTWKQNILRHYHY